MPSRGTRLLRCIFCQQTYTRNSALTRHIELLHTCFNCGESASNMANHRCEPIVGRGDQVFNPSPFTLVSSAFGVLETYESEVEREFITVEGVLRHYLLDVKRLLQYSLENFNNIKFQINLKILMMEVYSRGEGHKWFNSSMHVLLHANSSEIMIVSCGNMIISQLNNFVLMGSSWTIKRIEKIVLKIAQYVPFRGGYRSIPLPLVIRRRRGVASPPSDHCFSYCMAACYMRLNTKRSIERRQSYTRFFQDNLNNAIINFTGIGPVCSLQDIDIFLRNNQSFSVNVFGFDDGNTFPMKVTETKQYHANLLLLNNSEISVGHYLFLFDISAFLNIYRGTFFFCFYCMSKFRSEEEREAHSSQCRQYGIRRLEFFQQGQCETVNPAIISNRVPVILYFDFESEYDKRQSGHNVEAVLAPISFTYVLVSDEKILEYGGYIGEKADVVFVRKVIQLSEKYLPLMQKYKTNIIITEEGKRRTLTDTCYCCKLSIEAGQESAIHHNHTAFPVSGVPAGEIFGKTHASCNLVAKTNKFFKAASHVFSRFDSIQLIRGLADSRVTNISSVARSANDFISMKVNNVQFYDTYLHLPIPLRKAVEILRTSGMENFKYLPQVFANYLDYLPMLLSKQYFCYEYFNRQTMYVQSSNLPDIRHFHDTLTGNTITDDEWRHANFIYRLFSCNNLAEYCQLYCLVDSVALADVFTHHRRLTFQLYNTEVLSFLSSPSMAFRLCLLSTETELEYITDPTIYTTAKQSQRGGLVGYVSRYERSNQPSHPNYNPTEEPNTILYLDVTNMYGKAMLSPIPYGGYEILTSVELESFNIQEHDDDGEFGYLLTGDFHVEEEYHDFYDSLPPFPEKITIDPQRASQFQRDYYDDDGKCYISQFNQPQLNLNLYPKKNYSIHLFMLKLLLQIGGVRVDKITQIIRYKQSKWMAPFIQNVINRRKSTNDESLRAYYKVIANSVFGFSGLKVEDFISIKLVKTKEDCIKLASSPLFKSFNTITHNLSLFEMAPARVIVRNHMLVSSAILERSKTYLYASVYNGFKKYFTDNNLKFKLLYFDTDAILFSVNDFYDNVISHLPNITVNNEKIVDMSFLPVTHALHSTELKNKEGTFKSEVQEKQILEYVCLKKKTYSLLLDEEQLLKGKGVPKNVLKKEFSHNSYKHALFTGRPRKVKMKMMRRLNQMVQVCCTTKLALCSFSTSRWLHPPLGIESTAFGNVRLLDEETDNVPEENA